MYLFILQMTVVLTLKAFYVFRVALICAEMQKLLSYSILHLYAVV